MAHAHVLFDDLEPSPPPVSEVEPTHDDAGLLVRHRGQALYVAFGDVRVVEARGNYALLYTAGAKYMVRETMATLEARLGAHGFLRVHRSAIVNMAFVKGIVPRGSGDHVAVLVDGTRLRFGRMYYARLRQRKD
jgi:two-component system LytT family response regulator